MNQTTYQMELDVRKPGSALNGRSATLPVMVREGCASATLIRAAIRDNGDPVSLTGCTVTFKAKNQSGMISTPTVAEIEDEAMGMVSFTLPDNAASQKGSMALAYLEITDGQITETTEDFGLHVIGAARPTDAEAEALLDYLAQIKAQVDSMAAGVPGLVASASQSEESARAYAEAAKEAAMQVHAPQRGTDYWTDADQRQIVDDVLSALPTAEGVGF